MRCLYFPLRSSVELFEDRASVEASVRAKEGAVLFEEVIFEPGLLIANVGEQGNVVMYKGPDELGKDDLTGTRNPAGPGEEFVVSIGTEETPGRPRTVDASGSSDYDAQELFG